MRLLSLSRARPHTPAHYKFNLTNGSENLETMECMKCGRVYHTRAARATGQYCQGRFRLARASKRESVVVVDAPP